MATHQTNSRNTRSFAQIEASNKRHHMYYEEYKKCKSERMKTEKEIVSLTRRLEKAKEKLKTTVEKERDYYTKWNASRRKGNQEVRYAIRRAEVAYRTHRPRK